MDICQYICLMNGYKLPENFSRRISASASTAERTSLIDPFRIYLYLEIETMVMKVVSYLFLSGLVYRGVRCSIRSRNNSLMPV